MTTPFIIVACGTVIIVGLCCLAFWVEVRQ